MLVACHNVRCQGCNVHGSNVQHLHKLAALGVLLQNIQPRGHLVSRQHAPDLAVVRPRVHHRLPSSPRESGVVTPRRS